MALSWLFAHVQFAQHYAVRYYDAVADRPLEFPGREQPDDWDFSYFSIAVATTFGTTDVAVATGTGPMRRAVLGHAVFAFAYNTVIVALTISVLLGA